MEPALLQTDLPTSHQIGEIAAKHFEPVPLQRSLFLNAVPKCGTLLLRNILLMFVPASSIYCDEFVVDQNLAKYSDAVRPSRKNFLWGHVNHTDEAIRILSAANMLLMVRDPFDYALSYARFLFSDQFESAFARYVKTHNLPVERVISSVIFGNGNAELYFEELDSVYQKNAIAWLGGEAMLIRYEDVVEHIRDLETAESEAFFRQLVSACGFAQFPADWKERVRLGADRKLSSTARENLDIYAPIPDALTETQCAMIELAAPGLRRLLGYGLRQAL